MSFVARKALDPCKRLPADLAAAPGDENWLLELCLCLRAQRDLRGGTSGTSLPLRLFWLLSGFQLLDLGQQRATVSAGKLPCISWGCWQGKGVKEKQQHPLQETYLHPEQLLPAGVPPEPAHPEQRLCLQPASPGGQHGQGVQPHGQGVAVLVLPAGWEGERLRVPWGQAQTLRGRGHRSLRSPRARGPGMLVNCTGCSLKPVSRSTNPKFPLYADSCSWHTLLHLCSPFLLFPIL